MMMPAVGAAAASGSMDIGSLIAQVVGGGVGGAVIMFIVGLLKQTMTTPDSAK
jgi:membrane protein DedA with SNARE-associated domain